MLPAKKRIRFVCGAMRPIAKILCYVCGSVHIINLTSTNLISTDLVSPELCGRAAIQFAVAATNQNAAGRAAHAKAIDDFLTRRRRVVNQWACSDWPQPRLTESLHSRSV